MKTDTQVAPESAARTFETAKIERGLIQKRAAEFNSAPWWKAFLLRMRIRREADRILRLRQVPAATSPDEAKV
jgi:hypothetical protein